jgi:hypothetical protein
MINPFQKMMATGFVKWRQPEDKKLTPIFDEHVARPNMIIRRIMHTIFSVCAVLFKS